MSDEILGKLNFDESEFEFNRKVERKFKGRPNVDRRICACGHPMSRHKENPYIRDLPGVPVAYVCSPGNTPCTCKVPRPVLQAVNTKHFLMGSMEGGPTGHPLIRAIAKLKVDAPDEYKDLDWLDSPKCDKCEREDVVVTPIGFDLRARRFATKNQAGDRTFFLCDECRMPTAENPVIDSANDN